jgi:hypothetical protein
MQFLAKHKMAVIPHPPYPNDFASYDLFLSPQLKLKPKRRRFDTNEEIQAELQRVLDTMTEKESKNRSKNGRDGGIGVYNAGGNYFYGDGGR